MEKHLRKANKNAEEVLSEVTQKAKESEKIKESVSKVKDKAEKIVSQIGVEKAIAEEKLEAAKPALEEAEEALNTIKVDSSCDSHFDNGINNGIFPFHNWNVCHGKQSVTFAAGIEGGKIRF